MTDTPSSQQPGAQRPSQDAVGRLLAPGEVATLFGVTEGCLARWRSQGKPPTYHRIHGRIRYTLADINKFLDAGRK